MNNQISFPPLVDLTSDGLEAWKQHLLAEIGREPEGPRVALRRFTAPRRRWPLVSSARAIVVVPIALVVALTLVNIGGASLGTRAVHGIRSLWGTTPANQSALDTAADDAQSVAGSAFYTDAVVNDAANTVDVYLAGAPQSIIDQLQALHPGTYVIHNDAAHPRDELLKLEHSLPLAALSAQGIDVVSANATPDGYLSVGVSSDTDVQAAQSTLDAMDGPGIIKVYGDARPGTVTPGIVQVNPSSIGKVRTRRSRPQTDKR